MIAPCPDTEGSGVVVDRRLFNQALTATPKPPTALNSVERPKCSNSSEYLEKNIYQIVWLHPLQRPIKASKQTLPHIRSHYFFAQCIPTPSRGFLITWQIMCSARLLRQVRQVIAVASIILYVNSTDGALLALLMIAINLACNIACNTQFTLSHLEPDWMGLLYVLDCAIEFPFIFAFHPMNQTRHLPRTVPTPSDGQILLQVAVFFAVQMAFENSVLNYITVIPEAPATKHGSREMLVDSQEESCEAAERYVLMFLRPRGTLLLSVAILGTPSVLTDYSDKIHPMALVLWFALESMVEYSGHRDT